VLDVSREIIASAGFESLAFDSSAAYLDYVNTPAFAPATAILTCYLMPGMNGYELIAEVRKKYPLQKAVIISGTATDDTPFDTEHLVCLHLAKPWQAETLFKALKTLNICERTCTIDNGGGTFRQSCKFGLQHACPLYVTVEHDPEVRL